MTPSASTGPISEPSGARAPEASPLLPLPGFMPDAMNFAVRLPLAMLLAYLVSFTIQLESASSAGVCVGIVMQPSPGMTVSKAVYRTAGTLVGGAAALVIGGLFPQDRTMLLLAFAAWLAACAYVATLLRDFRAYGAVLAGYTVAIICIAQIDTPGNLLITTLDRVAAILIGILSVAVVNSFFLVASAHRHLLVELRRQLEEARVTAVAVLSAGTKPVRDVSLDRAADLLALRTDAAYATAELADGLRRNRAATAALAALLNMLGTSRELGRAQEEHAEIAQDTHAYMKAVAKSLNAGTPPVQPPPAPRTPLDALLIERAGSLARDYEQAELAIAACATGLLDGVPRRVRIPSDLDHSAALLNAVRAAIGAGLGAAVCLVGNDPNTSLVLIQLAATVSMFGLLPDPSAAAATLLPSLPLPVVLAGIVEFLLLPLASGFVPFALSVGPAVFILGLVSRHPATARFGPMMLVNFTLLLSPSNVQSFDLSVFVNQVLQLMIAAVLTVVTLRFVMPVDPHLDLVRVADKIVRSLRSTLHGSGTGPSADSDEPQPSLHYDRLRQALQWARARRPGPHPVMTRLCMFAELDAATRRAMRGLNEASARLPAVLPLIRTVWASFTRADADGLDAAAAALLAPDDTEATSDAVLRAVSGLHGAAVLIRRQGSALYRYGVIES